MPVILRGAAGADQLKLGQNSRIIPATVGPGPLVPFAPSRPSWDFDDESVSYNTTTFVSQHEGVSDSIDWAMQQKASDVGTLENPKFHDIVYTGGDYVGDVNYNYTDPANANGLVYMRVRPQTPYRRITGQVRMSNGGCKDVLLKEWEIAPDATAQQQWCVRAFASGSRFSVAKCRLGRFWIAGARLSFPFGVSAQAGDCNFTVRDTELRDLFQAVDYVGGICNLKRNFVTGLRDDFWFISVRQKAPGFAYIYGCQNVILNHHDAAADSASHCDMGQTGNGQAVPPDAATDELEVELCQELYLGDTWQQYATHAAFIQRGGSSLIDRSKLKAHDCLFNPTGRRGIANCDDETEIRRCVIAAPPLGGANTFQNPGFLPGVENESPLRGGANGPAIHDNILAAAYHDTNGRGFPQAGPDIVANPYQATGSNEAYDFVFPDMPNMNWVAGPPAQWLIDTPTEFTNPTMSSVRQWCADSYKMNTVANGKGWEENNFNSPDRWTG